MKAALRRGTVGGLKGRLLLAVSWLTLCALVAPAVPPALEPPPAGDGAVPVEPVPEPALEPPPAAAEAPLATPTPPRAPAQSPSLAPAPPPEPDPAPEAVAQAPDPPARDTPIAFAAAPGSVSIRDFAFGPASVTVGVGETVTWSNDDSTEHTATATDGSFDTGLLGRGESGGATFESAGTFSYLCQPHPFMKGTVRVVGRTRRIPSARADARTKKAQGG